MPMGEARSAKVSPLVPGNSGADDAGAGVASKTQRRNPATVWRGLQALISHPPCCRTKVDVETIARLTAELTVRHIAETEVKPLSPTSGLGISFCSSSFMGVGRRASVMSFRPERFTVRRIKTIVTTQWVALRRHLALPLAAECHHEENFLQHVRRVRFWQVLEVQLGAGVDRH